MVPSGPRNPAGRGQSVSPELMQLNSAILESQGGSIAQQTAYSSLVPPRARYNVNMLGNTSNISSILNQSFGIGGTASGLLNMNDFQGGSFDTTAKSDPHSFLANDLDFSRPHPSFVTSSGANSAPPGPVQNQQISSSSWNNILLDQTQSQVQQLDPQKDSQQSIWQLSLSHSKSQQQQRQLQSVQGGLGGGGPGPVKLEPQTTNDQIDPQKQLQALQNIGAVKLESQQNHIGRVIRPVKLEQQHSDQAMLLLQQQQQQVRQQFLQSSMQSSQAAHAQMTLLQQHRILQQLQHQQQLLKALPHQRPQLQQQFQQQNFALGPVYEPGTCARRLALYMYQQQHRPKDNNIEFWRKFVAEFFAPNARKRWCISLYGNSLQINGVFAQDLWNCEICNRKPGRGFETTVDVFPCLFKMKYESGVLEELLYVDMPCEYQNANGQIVLHYAKATQESVFEHLRVVRDGQLRIVFSPDIKICSWEFCVWRHEELIPRRLLIPQVSQLGTAAQNYRASAQNASSNSSTPDLLSNCNAFVASARQLAKTLDVPLVNDLGYTKRYVRCLQISEVVNSMKDLIDYSRETGIGPMESLVKFSQRRGTLPAQNNSAEKYRHHQQQQHQHQQQLQKTPGENANKDQNSHQTSTLLPSSNGVASVSTSAGTVIGLLHQNSITSRTENQINNPSSPYSGTPVQIPSACSSTTLAQANPPSPFSTPSSSNNYPQSSNNGLAASTTINNVSSANPSPQIPPPQSSQLREFDPSESQSSVEKIIQEIMMSSRFNEAGDNAKNINSLRQVIQNSESRGGFTNSNTGISGGSYNGICLSPGGNMMRAALANNSVTVDVSGRASMPFMPQDVSSQQQQELVNRLLNGLGATNGFCDLQFD